MWGTVVCVYKAKTPHTRQYKAKTHTLMSVRPLLLYFIAHALLVCTAMALTYTNIVVDFEREFRTAVYLCVILLWGAGILEGLVVFSSARARRLTVWMIYLYFTAPVVLLWCNMCDRAGERMQSNSDRAHRNIEVLVYCVFLVLPGMGRLLMLTCAGYLDFMKLNVSRTA